MPRPQLAGFDPSTEVRPDVVKTLALLALRVEEEKGAPNAERPYEDRIDRYKELLALYRERQASRKEP